MTISDPTPRRLERNPLVDRGEFWRDFAPGLDASSVIWSEVIPGGAHASWLFSRGTVLHLAALEAHANCSIVVYAAPPALEGYSMPDSLKAQYTAHLTRGNVLISDMGRAMVSIVEDSVGWHDPMGSLLDTPTMERRYGIHRFDPHRNERHQSGRDGLLIEISKYGFAARDLIAPVNLFSKISVDAAGRFHYHEAHAAAGAVVALRFDMDVLLALSTAPHALDPGTTYRPSPIGCAAWRSVPAPADDFCRNFCGENARAHYNADIFARR